MAATPKHSPKRRAQWRSFYWRNVERLREQNKKRHTAWRNNNGDEHRRRAMEYYKKHPSSTFSEAQRKRKRAANRAWYSRNLENQRQRTRDRKRLERQIDRQHARLIHKKWRLSNPQKIRAKSACSRALKKGALLKDRRLIEQWMQEVKSKPFCRCHWCGDKFASQNVHFDHIVALSKGGEHSISNLCTTCPDCNLQKGNRLIADWLCDGQTFLSL